MKKIIILVFLLPLFYCIEKKEVYSEYPISELEIRNVEIKDKFWLPKIEMIQNITIHDAIEKCEREGRMQNFLVAGGLQDGAYKGKMPFDDTDLYKIIEGASYSLISNPNTELELLVDSLINIIRSGQEKDGYLTTWFTIDRKNPPAWWVKPSEYRWEHLESSHELYNSGHLFEAAAAHYHATGKRSFLDIALKNADLLVDNFGPNKLHTPPGHQIVETGLIKLYNITHHKEYLDLAKFFLDIRGDSTYEKSSGEYSQDHIPVVEQTEAVGHAVRALYMYAGMTDIAVLYEDTDYLNAVKKIWQNVYNKKMYITGGLGSLHDGEAFGDNYYLPNLTAYNETCAAIASVYWNHRLALLTGDSKYFDIIERTLYNGLISGISLDGTKYFYPNPTESDGEYKFNMGSCTRQQWFDCSCCPTNLIRFIPSIPGLIYSLSKDTVYVNLFVSSKAEISLGNSKIEIEQKTNNPWEGKISIQLNTDSEKPIALKVRIPGWSRNLTVPGDLYHYAHKYNDQISIEVNGNSHSVEMEKGYAVISKKWMQGDEIELTLPMKIRQVVPNEEVIENKGKVAIEYGPIVYCAEEIDNPNFSDIKLPKLIEMNTELTTILNEQIVSISSKIGNKKLILIPYYAWSNRGAGKMKVWF